MINENEFFRNATLKICSSLNPDKALWELLNYVKDFIPIRGMNLGLVDTKNVILHFIAWASLKNDKPPYPKIQLPQEQKKAVARDWEESERFFIYNDLEALGQDRMRTLKLIWPCNAMLTMKFDVEGQRIGGMTMWMDEKRGFTDDRVRLISLLHDPVAIAMSNILKHLEVHALKKMLTHDNQYLREQLIQISGNKVIGEDSGLKQVMEMVRQVAPLDSPVLLFGETGVGKEIVANVIHGSSNRKDKPFIKVNCGAIPESLIDSELFGYEKGAFTGAVAKKPGKFELADTGTIFLDEIGELSQQAQIRLLRVIQEKEIDRLGGAATVPIDVRIICATHRNIYAMIEKGLFREDLWFRLNVFPILIPPLRHRTEDIPALVHYFVKKKATEMKVRKQPVVDTRSLEALADYRWPGNVRELENIVERALIRNRTKGDADFLLFDDMEISMKNTSIGTAGGGSRNLPGFENAMKSHIQQALRICQGKIEGLDGAACLLELNPNTLRSKMRKLGVNRKS